MLDVQPRQPGRGLRASERDSCILGQGQVVSGVPLPDGAASACATSCSLPYSRMVSSIVTRGPPGGRSACPTEVVSCWSRLLAASDASPSSTACRPGPRQPIRPGPAAAGRGDCLGRIQGAAPGEHAHSPEERLVRLVQQLIAPGDGVPHGLLPVRQIVHPAGQHRQPLAQLVQQRRRGQQPGPGCGQFNGQGQPFQPPADLRYHLGRRGVQRQFGTRGAGALHEELHRR